jgi:hypothetical protein
MLIHTNSKVFSVFLRVVPGRSDSAILKAFPLRAIFLCRGQISRSSCVPKVQISPSSDRRRAFAAKCVYAAQIFSFSQRHTGHRAHKGMLLRPCPSECQWHTNAGSLCTLHEWNSVCSGAQKKMQPCIVNRQPAASRPDADPCSYARSWQVRKRNFNGPEGEKSNSSGCGGGRFVPGMCLFILKSHKYTHNPNSFRVIYCPRSHKEIWKRCCACYSGVPPRGWYILRLRNFGARWCA